MADVVFFSGPVLASADVQLIGLAYPPPPKLDTTVPAEPPGGQVGTPIINVDTSPAPPPDDPAVVRLLGIVPPMAPVSICPNTVNGPTGPIPAPQFRVTPTLEIILG